MSSSCRARWIGALLSVLLPCVALAESAPLLFNFQGRLTDSVGVPVTGSTELLVTLFQGGTAVEAVSSGTKVYRERAIVTPDANGVFAYAIGGGAPVEGLTLEPADFDTVEPLFVELSIGGETLLPRTRLVSAAFALEVSRLEGNSASQIIARGGGLEAVKRRARNGTLVEYVSGTQVRVGPGVLGFSDARVRKNRADLIWDAANGVALLGLDAGTMAGNAFYYLYAVPDPVDDTQFSAVASVGAPVEVGGSGPSGYAIHRFLGSFRTDGAAAVLRFYRSAGNVFFQGRIGDWLSGSGAQPATDTWVYVDASSFMPQTSRAVMINGYYDERDSSAAYTFYVAPTAGGPSTRICTDWAHGASGCDATIPTIGRAFYYYADLPSWASNAASQTTKLSYRGYQEDLREF